MATKLNKDYAKPDAEMKPVFAPAAFNLGGRDYIHPTAEDYAKAGYLPLSPDYPVDPPEGKHYEQTDKIEPNGENGYRWVYALVDNPPPAPRVFSKLKCVAALMEAGVWQEVKGYIEGAGLYDLYLAAQDFREDNPYFVSGKAQLMASLGWTEEQAEALLAKCVIGGV